MWSVWLVFCDCGFESVCPLMDQDKRLMKLPDGRDWLRGKLGLVLFGGGHALWTFNPILCWSAGLCSLPIIYLSPNCGGGNEDNDNLPQKVACMQCYTQCPWPCSRPPPTPASARDSWTLLGKSGSVSCGVTAPFSWVLVHTRFCLCPPRVCFPSPVWVLAALCWVNGDLLQDGLCHAQVYCTQSPFLCSSPLLTHMFSGDTQTQFCLRLCGVSGSWCT